MAVFCDVFDLSGLFFWSTMAVSMCIWLWTACTSAEEVFQATIPKVE